MRINARPATGIDPVANFPVSLQAWAGLITQAVNAWLDDRAPTMGAAIAFYTVFSLAPMLMMVIAVAGFAFGQQAAEGALFGELAELIGPDSAGAAQAMLRSLSNTRSGIIATTVGIGTLIVAATAVFGELQSALNVIWKAPTTASHGVWHLLKSRLLSLSIILVIGFVLLVSLVISAALAAFSQYLDQILPGLPTILHILHLALSFLCATVLFALMFKILPDKPVEICRQLLSVASRAAPGLVLWPTAGAGWSGVRGLRCRGRAYACLQINQRSPFHFAARGERSY